MDKSWHGKEGMEGKNVGWEIYILGLTRTWDNAKVFPIIENFCNWYLEKLLKFVLVVSYPWKKTTFATKKIVEIVENT